MKRIILSVAFLLSIWCCFGQVFTQELPPDTSKPRINYVLIYRELSFGGSLIISNGNAWPEPRTWKTVAEPFGTLYDLLKRLNGKSYDGKPIVMIDEENIIGIYDLVMGGRVELKLKTEKKSTPKKIVVESEEWVEQQYEIKRKNL